MKPQNRPSRRSIGRCCSNAVAAGLALFTAGRAQAQPVNIGFVPSIGFCQASRQAVVCLGGEFGRA